MNMAGEDGMEARIHPQLMRPLPGQMGRNILSAAAGIAMIGGDGLRWRQVVHEHAGHEASCPRNRRAQRERKY